MGRVEEFVRQLAAICDDNSHGYDQVHRWGPDYDCSSLMYTCAHNAGYDVPTGSGYTGTMRRDFTRAGWEAVPYVGQDLSALPAGCIILNEGNHTEGVIAPGEWGGAHINEHGTATGGMSGDQTGREISRCAPYKYSLGWDYILYPPEYQEDGMTIDYDFLASKVVEKLMDYEVRNPENGFAADLKWRIANLGDKTQTMADALRDIRDASVRRDG